MNMRSYQHARLPTFATALVTEIFAWLLSAPRTGEHPSDLASVCPKSRALPPAVVLTGLALPLFSSGSAWGYLQRLCTPRGEGAPAIRHGHAFFGARLPSFSLLFWPLCVSFSFLLFLFPGRALFSALFALSMPLSGCNAPSSSFSVCFMIRMPCLNVVYSFTLALWASL